MKPPPHNPGRSVFTFLKNPLGMWKSGNLQTQRAVLRLVFDGPLVYDRESGFGTAGLSLPLAIGMASAAHESTLVDLLGKSWNRLEAQIREWAELIQGLRQAETGHLAA